MPLPVPIEGVPPGLEYLTMVDKIKIHQVKFFKYSDMRIGSCADLNAL